MSNMPGFSRIPVNAGKNGVVAKSNERTPDPERVALIKRLDTLQEEFDALKKKVATIEKNVAKLK